jgi:hypothetical protein
VPAVTVARRGGDVGVKGKSGVGHEIKIGPSGVRVK